MAGYKLATYQTSEDTEQRRFSAARRADDCENFALPDGEGDVLENGQRAELVMNAVDDQFKGHSPRPASGRFVVCVA